LTERLDIQDKLKNKKMMNNLERAGKKNTILISISILLVSLHTIYFYNSVISEVETKKLIQQIIRFLLTIGLLIFVYKGKKWARIVFLVLFSIGILGAIFALISIEQSIVNKIPLMVMVIVYSVSLYHFGISKSFKAFYLFQNEKNKL